MRGGIEVKAIRPLESDLANHDSMLIQAGWAKDALDWRRLTADEVAAATEYSRQPLRARFGSKGAAGRVQRAVRLDPS